MKKKPVINIEDVEFTSYSHGSRYQGQIGSMANAIGARKIGCRLMVVPAGKTGYPYHNHRGNEEMFYIIEGEGKYRFGGEEYSIKQGDLIAAPAGGQDTAHQIVNDSGSTLRYLALSTMIDPDVVEYPEIGKFGVVAGKAPGGPDSEDQFIHVAWTKDGIDYWEGES